MIRAGSVARGAPLVAKGDPRHVGERNVCLYGVDHPQDRLFAFAADDDVDLRLVGQDLAPVVGGEHAAVDDPGRRQRLAQGTRDLDDGGMAGGGAGVAQEDGLGGECHGLRHDLGRGQRTEFRVQEPHLVSRVDQRPANR